jgi:hypothetical protein
MKKLILTSLLLGAAGLMSAAETLPASGFYTEAAAVYAFPGDFDDVLGGSLALGYRINSTQKVEVETIYFESNAHHYGPSVRFVPILLKGKYTMPIGQNWSCTVAIAGGAVIENMSSGYLYYGRDDVAAAFGGEASLDYQINERTSIGAGATVLGLTATNITTKGSIALIKFKFGIRF